MDGSTQDLDMVLGDTERLWVEGVVHQILRSDQRDEQTLRHMRELDAQGKPRLVVAIYEALYWQAEIRSYWVVYQAMLSYRQIRRFDAAYLTACLADQMDPRSSGALIVNEIKFEHMMRSGAKRQALAVFQNYMLVRPEHPFIAAPDIQPLIDELNAEAKTRPPERRDADPARQDIRVVDESVRPFPRIEVYGRFFPPVLRDLQYTLHRPAIDVAYLEDGEVLIKDNAVVVLDRNGLVQDDLSVHEFPTIFSAAFDKLPASEVETHSVDVAAILSDRYPIINLAHNLSDHLTRVALYTKAGMDQTEATFIGPAIPSSFQKRLYALFGVSNRLSTDRVARVRVRQLYVSTNCKDILHPCHQGMPWALDAIRSRLGGAVERGERSLYISRRDASYRNMANEKEVARFLEQRGFETIALGEMAYDQQIAAFSAARRVVGTHGAGMYHVALCAPGTPVLEMFHPLSTPSGVAIMSNAANLDYAALVGFDGYNDDPEFNEPASINLTIDYLRRDLRVDLAEIDRWLTRTA